MRAYRFTTVAVVAFAGLMLSACNDSKSPVSLVDPELRTDRTSALGEERHGLLARERRDGMLVLGRNAQRLPARDEQLETWGDRQQVGKRDPCSLPRAEVPDRTRLHGSRRPQTHSGRAAGVAGSRQASRGLAASPIRPLPGRFPTRSLRVPQALKRKEPVPFPGRLLRASDRAVSANHLGP